MDKIKVLIVDDSVIIQTMLKEMFSQSPNLEVIGTAFNPLEAREIIKKNRPDVVILDIVMPQMDGMTFLKNLMRLRPLPVIMFSSIAQKNSPIVLEALSMGAVQCLPKPTRKEIENIQEYARQLVTIVEQAAKVNVDSYASRLEETPRLVGFETQSNRYQSPILTETVVGIGSSMGGNDALEGLLTQFPGIMPSIVVSQLIGTGLEEDLRKRLDKACSLVVENVAQKGEILPGRVYLANASKKLTVEKGHLHYLYSLEDPPLKEGHNPVDELFISIAKSAGPNSVGILLGSMGSDGEKGFEAIKNAGGSTIMLESSYMKGIKAVDYVLPLNKICAEIFRILDKKAAI